MRALTKCILCLFFSFILICGGIFAADAVEAISGSPSEEVLSHEPVSPGLYHLAAATDMVVSAEVGELYYFEAEDFLRAMNLSSLEYITVTEAPSASVGTLFLGASAVQSGQVISCANLERMTYSSATGGTGVGSFRFSVEDSGYSLECRVYGVTETGEAPTSAYAPEMMLAVGTYRDLSCESKLPGYDPDGDALVYEIVTPPAHGSVRLLDRGEGTYVYIPYAGYTGEDSFRYVVRDAKGNYSTSRAVTMTISEPTVSVEFADLYSDSAVSVALRMTENGIMSGTEVGGKVFFYPDETVSRVDFLVMAMRTFGLDDVDNSAKTVFLDDAEIPASLRGYVARAYEMGVVNGTFGADGLYFQPSRAVTRAEVSKILSELIGVSESVSAEVKSPASVAVGSVVFDDMLSIPAWAEEAVYHLSALGVFTDADGKADVTASLTRADAAEMLSKLLTLLS